MAELKALDVGYGYTFDGGRTYPFRGRGVGLMPSLDEVFQTFPDRSFLIDVKDNEPEVIRLLSDHLSRLPSPQLSKLMIFARDESLAILRERFPAMQMFSAGSVAACLLRYIAYGWTGIVPASCSNAAIFVPVNVAPWLWGWPAKFMNRMESSGSATVVMGPFPSREISPGLDSQDFLSRLPAGYSGGIWTNEVGLANRYR
jgi:glycerophosphoryl diester phosphodiesterase